MRRRVFGSIVTALALMACSGGDVTVATSGAAESSTDALVGGDGEGADDALTGGESASIRVGDSTYEFSDATDCFPDPEGAGGLAIRFDSGSDFVSLNQAGDTVLARARLDGREYADTGSAAPPVVSGTVVTWSGEMGADGETYDVEISISC